MVGQTKTTGNTARTDERATGPHPILRPAARARALIDYPEEWIKRAEDFAWQYHMINALRWVYTDENGANHYAAPSRSHPEQTHHVIVDVPHEYISCSCPAFAHLNPCPHVGAAYHLFRQALAASLARNMAGQRQYEWFSYYSDAS